MKFICFLLIKKYLKLKCHQNKQKTSKINRTKKISKIGIILQNQFNVKVVRTSYSHRNQLSSSKKDLVIIIYNNSKVLQSF
jgi:hypothetical protein